ncbi:MAG: hypothetical protein MHM6MM_000845 [Cercozoa sp. M6MM]
MARSARGPTKAELRKAKKRQPNRERDDSRRQALEKQKKALPAAEIEALHSSGDAAAWYSRESTQKLPRDIVEIRNEQDARKKATALLVTMSKSSQAAAHRDFLEQMAKDGTAEDRVNAMALLVQSAPLHNLVVLQRLVAHCNKATGGGGHKGVKVRRQEAAHALQATADLFGAALLPARPLRAFSEHPWDTAKRVPSAALMLCAYEDRVKVLYTQFLAAVGNALRDQQEWLRARVLNIASQLAQARPEQRQLLASHITNKLGDTSRKVASKASLVLSRLFQTYCRRRYTAAVHARHKKDIWANVKEQEEEVDEDYEEVRELHDDDGRLVLLREAEQFVTRPQLPQRAQYYALTFLAQVVLRKSPAFVPIAMRLVRVYLSLFESVARAHLGDKESAGTEESGMQSKLLSTLLTGLNRAFPFCPFQNENYESQFERLYALTHDASLPTATQALSLLFQAQYAASGQASDRFYRALYALIASPALSQVAAPRVSALLNLVFRALKASPEQHKKSKKNKKKTSKDAEKQGDDWQDAQFRAAAFCRRLLRVAASQRASLAAALLILVAAVLQLYPRVAKLVRQGENPEGEGFDPTKREPRFANAQNEALWELRVLCSHFHPSVRHFASQLAQGEKVEYEGDALADFTHLAFLDRFVRRNPKKAKKVRISVFDSQRVRQEFGGTGSEDFMREYLRKQAAKKRARRQVASNSDELEALTEAEMEAAIEAKMRQMAGNKANFDEGLAPELMSDMSDVDDFEDGDDADDDGDVSDTVGEHGDLDGDDSDADDEDNDKDNTVDVFKDTGFANVLRVDDDFDADTGTSTA